MKARETLTALHFVTAIDAIHNHITFLMRRNAVRLVEDVLPATEHAVVAVGRRTGLELVLSLLAVLLVIAHPQRRYTFALGTFEHSAGAWHGGAVSIRIWGKRKKRDVIQMLF